MSGQGSVLSGGYARLTNLMQDSHEPMMVMQRVVDESLKLVGGADGAVVELLDPDGVTLTYVCCTGTLWHSLGLRLHSESSLSGLALRSRSTLICADSETDPRVDRDACRKVGTISMVCVPLTTANVPLGVLKVSSVEANAFSESDVRVLSGLAEFIAIAVANANEMKRVTSDLLSGRLESDSRSPYPNEQIADFVSNIINPSLDQNLYKRRRVESVLGSEAMSFLFQPIVDLDANVPCGAEALARFDIEPHQTPDLWFSDAQSVGLGTELELEAARRALGHLPELPAEITLAVNIGPEAMMSDRMMQMIQAIDPSKAVIELTEHAQVEDYPRLVERFAQIRGLGVRLAIDDTGSGFSSFSHIIKLSPDVMKLDRELIQNIDKDPVRMSLTTAVVTFASDTGTEVIAEGIETREELETLISLGVRLGQGYFLGRPGSLADLIAATA